MQICTVVASNYLPQARVLAQSFLRNHPSGRVTVLLLDAEAAPPEVRAEDAFEVLAPRDLGLSRREFHTMAAMYTVTELATAIKPWLLEFLIRRSEAVVSYLDPDIEVHDDLSEIDDRSADGSIVLTPHVVRPYTLDSLFPDDLDLLVSGGFNLGFIAVPPERMDFLHWWQARLARHCLHAVEQGYFVDQKWIDLAHHLFPTVSLRSEAYNVAYWNLHTRELTKTDRWYINGEPLKFFHFSGFRPERAERLTSYLRGPSRVLAEERPALRKILDSYSSKLREAGYLSTGIGPYGYARSSSGLFLTPDLRRAYRDLVLFAEQHGEEAPDPFSAHDEARFDLWAATADPPVLARLPRTSRTRILGLGQHAALAVRRWTGGARA